MRYAEFKESPSEDASNKETLQEDVRSLSTSLSFLSAEKEVVIPSEVREELEKVDNEEKSVAERYESIKNHLVEKYGLSNEYAALITSYYLVSNGVSAEEVAEKLYNDLEEVAGEWKLYTSQQETLKQLREKLTLSLTLLTYRMTGEVPSGKGAELAEAEVENGELYIAGKYGSKGKGFFSAIVHFPLSYFQVGENAPSVNMKEVMDETGIVGVEYKKSENAVVVRYSDGREDVFSGGEFRELIKDIYIISGLDERSAEEKAEEVMKIVKQGGFGKDVERAKGMLAKLELDVVERYILSYWVVRGARADESRERRVRELTERYRQEGLSREEAREKAEEAVDREIRKEVEKGRYAVFILVYGRPPKSGEELEEFWERFKRYYVELGDEAPLAYLTHIRMEEGEKLLTYHKNYEVGLAFVGAEMIGLHVNSIRDVKELMKSVNRYKRNKRRYKKATEVTLEGIYSKDETLNETRKDVMGVLKNQALSADEKADRLIEIRQETIAYLKEKYGLSDEEASALYNAMLAQAFNSAGLSKDEVNDISNKMREKLIAMGEDGDAFYNDVMGWYEAFTQPSLFDLALPGYLLLWEAMDSGFSSTVEESVEVSLNIDDYLYGEEEKTDFPIIYLLAEYLPYCCPERVVSYYDWLKKYLEEKAARKEKLGKERKRKFAQLMEKVNIHVMKGMKEAGVSPEEARKVVEDTNKRIETINLLLQQL